MWTLRPGPRSSAAITECSCKSPSSNWGPGVDDKFSVPCDFVGDKICSGTMRLRAGLACAILKNGNEQDQKSCLIFRCVAPKIAKSKCSNNEDRKNSKHMNYGEEGPADLILLWARFSLANLLEGGTISLRRICLLKSTRPACDNHCMFATVEYASERFTCSMPRLSKCRAEIFFGRKLFSAKHPDWSSNLVNFFIALIN